MQIAFRNIFRNKRRTIITDITIVLGMVVLIFASGMLKCMETNWRDNLILSDLGHVQIMAKGLKKEDSLKSSISDSRDLKAILANNNKVKFMADRINVSGLISTGENTAIFFGAGINPRETLDALPKIADSKKMVDGAFLRDNSLEDAVIGQGLAEKLNVKVGDRIMLVTNDKYDAMNSVDIMITGIIKISDQFTNDHIVYFNIDNARILTGFETNEVSRIVVTLNCVEYSIPFYETIKKQLPSDKVEIFTWHDLSTYLNSIVALWEAINAILIAILLTLTLVSIMNTILMSVFERTREIGTSMALGASRAQIVLIFLFESFFIGILGVVIGVVLGVVINFSISMMGGINLPPPPGETKGVNLEPLILPYRIFFISVLVIIASFLAGLYPANHAAKEKPVDALRAN